MYGLPSNSAFAGRVFGWGSSCCLRMFCLGKWPLFLVLWLQRADFWWSYFLSVPLHVAWLWTFPVPFLRHRKQKRKPKGTHLHIIPQVLWSLVGLPSLHFSEYSNICFIYNVQDFQMYSTKGKRTVHLFHCPRSRHKYMTFNKN